MWENRVKINLSLCQPEQERRLEWLLPCPQELQHQGSPIQGHTGAAQHLAEGTAELWAPCLDPLIKKLQGNNLKNAPLEELSRSDSIQLSFLLSFCQVYNGVWKQIFRFSFCQDCFSLFWSDLKANYFLLQEQLNVYWNVLYNPIKSAIAQ